MERAAFCADLPTMHGSSRVGFRPAARALSVLLFGVAAAGCAAGLSRSPVPPPAASVCPAAAECFESARAVIDRGATDEAIEFLTVIRSQWPETAWAGRAAFWIGKLAVGRDDSSAIAWGLRASTELPLVGDHALAYAAEAARRDGQTERAARLLDTLVRLFPVSPLAPGALATSAELWSQVAGHRAEAIARRQDLVDRYPQDAAVPSSLAALGDALAAEGRADEAAAAYRRLWVEFAASSEATLVAARLDDLIRQGASPPQTFEERRRRAEGLGRAGRHAEALEGWKLLARSPATPAMDREITLRMATTLYRLRRWDEAWTAFRSLGASAAGAADVREEALLWEGRAAFRREDGAALRRAEAALARAYPQSPRRLELNSLRAAWHRGRGEWAEALGAYRALSALATAMRRGDKVVEAQWYLGWLEYRRGAPDAALAAFERGLAAAPPSDPQIPQLLYWMGQIESRLGAVEAARARAADLVTRYPYTYYGYLARRAARTDADPVPADPRRPSADGAERLDARDRGLPPRAEELRLLGLRSEAREEYLSSLRRSPPPPERVSDAAAALARLGADDEALRLLRRQFAPALERGDPSLPPAFWLLAYPGHLLDPIRTAGRGRIDPFLVAGLIREESVYDPKAVSPVGALGLMQVMPDTGRRVARAAGLTSFAVEQLFTPEVNLAVGVRYLADLLDRFAGNEAYAVAAYNAGPEAVVKWIENGPPRPIEEFVEEIPFQETRWYVKRVLRSAWEYRALYGTPATATVAASD
jgi:soluble lytic murein transglycosylase